MHVGSKDLDVARRSSRGWASRRLLAFGLAMCAGACASAPPPPPPAPPVIPAAQKLASILWLEDLRVLRDPNPPAPAPPPPPAKRGAPVLAPAAPPVADLLALATDGEARVRRRTAIALGRVGLDEGRPALEGLLKDADEEVRQMAAFGLGLLNDRGAGPALLVALQVRRLVAGARPRGGGARPHRRDDGDRAHRRARVVDRPERHRGRDRAGRDDLAARP